MSGFKQSITVILPNGKEVLYHPDHTPVVTVDRNMSHLVWETETGNVMSISVNMDQVSVLEIIASRADQEDEILDLLDEAKRRERAKEPVSPRATERDETEGKREEADE